MIKMASTRFFTSSLSDTNIQQDVGSFISVGEEQFQAFSVALIDAILNKQRLNEATLEKIVNKFFSCYPQYKVQKSYSSFSAYMNILINSPRRAQMVACMAVVLKQLALDEVYDKDNCLKYREIFANLGPTVPKSFLRETACSLPPSIFRALAQTLNLGITLSVIEPEKKLRKKESYNPGTGTGQFEVELQLQSGSYFPKIKDSNKSYFASISQSAVQAPPAELDPSEGTETIANMLNKIAADNENLKHTFKTWHNRLLLILQSGGKDCLVHLQKTYFNFLLLPQKVFIDPQKLNDLSKQPSNTAEPLNENQSVVTAVAEWIITHDLNDVDKFFAHFESLSKIQASKAQVADKLENAPHSEKLPDTYILEHSQEDTRDLDDAPSFSAFR